MEEELKNVVETGEAICEHSLAEEDAEQVSGGYKTYTDEYGRVNMVCPYCTNYYNMDYPKCTHCGCPNPRFKKKKK